jgi:hypothetical protein
VGWKVVSTRRFRRLKSEEGGLGFCFLARPIPGQMGKIKAALRQDVESNAQAQAVIGRNLASEKLKSGEA